MFTISSVSLPTSGEVVILFMSLATRDTFCIRRSMFWKSRPSSWRCKYKI
jgi:hypothetical protein